jgi:hypothetical protein
MNIYCLLPTDCLQDFLASLRFGRTVRAQAHYVSGMHACVQGLWLIPPLSLKDETVLYRYRLSVFPINRGAGTHSIDMGVFEEGRLQLDCIVPFLRHISMYEYLNMISLALKVIGILHLPLGPDHNQPLAPVNGAEIHQ